MYEFLDRLVNVSIPRIRDFRGLNPKAFDGRGNFNMGITEQIMFPEVECPSRFGGKNQMAAGGYLPQSGTPIPPLLTTDYSMLRLTPDLLGALREVTHLIV